ncbi:adenine-specific methyltransferase EcoRI family protein [Gordonia amicalis]|uniref:Adenine-specific methyltransferase EcoRI family protein n=1 Tax=Gordonia amicalis TaxID=89053 RepID=A0ABU4DFR8_9ACTN|nr:adenine-specific methyltransferase EcoRI family protein [Gordonia amicalis]MDV6308087.1 adenine-specific methyltransferase EcoRI family protein [Gordonia amicalis]
MTSTETARYSNLRSARSMKNDEFYTQWADIEREMNAYLDYDPDVFRDKIILLPCDDPEWSNFAKFFALHFHDFGLKKLIATSYAPDSNPGLPSYQPTLFEIESPQFDQVKTRTNGKLFVLDRDVNGDGIIDIDDLQWQYLEGDGDFRSAEVTALRDEADIVITNPPFSLFRTFLAWILDGKKKFAVIGNGNATTYKEVFPLIRENQMWKGATANNSDMVFGVPKGAPIKPSDREKAERLGYPSDEKFDYTRLGNSCWFTNIEHGRRHEPLDLMTAADNTKFSKHKEVRGIGYRTYDNYDAIEVPFTDAIPSDYNGVMGVPISFLDRFNPEQFEIVGIAKAPLGQPSRIYPKQTQIDKNGVRSQVTKLNDGPVIKVDEPPADKTYYEIDGEYFVQLYARILIRRKADA